jgi:uncharacterized protein
MRILVLGLITMLCSAVSCRGESRQQPATGSAVVAPDPVASNDPWATDPWDTGTPRGTSGSEGVPSLSDRKRLADAACPTVTAPYFYRIEKAGKVSHILGTRHVGVPLSKFPRAVHEAIESAKLAVFEIAPDDESDFDDVDLALADELGPTLWSRYRSLVGTEVARSMERATPASALLFMMVMHEDIGAMLDMEIQSKFQAAHIPTRGLETHLFQGRVLAKLLDLRMLRAAIEQTEDRRELANDSRTDLAEYCAGTDDSPGTDPEDRKEMIASGYTAAEIDQIDEELVYARNADWIPKLEPMLDAGGAFIAVGADHLSGKRGVIALLAARGYKTMRVK